MRLGPSWHTAYVISGVLIAMGAFLCHAWGELIERRRNAKP